MALPKLATSPFTTLIESTLLLSSISVALFSRLLVAASTDIPASKLSSLLLISPAVSSGASFVPLMVMVAVFAVDSAPESSLT